MVRFGPKTTIKETVYKTKLHLIFGNFVFVNTGEPLDQQRARFNLTSEANEGPRWPMHFGASLEVSFKSAESAFDGT